MDFGFIALLGAFGAGVLSFASPCVFPLIPAYLAQLTGLSFQELTGSQNSSQRGTILVNSLAFVVGLAVLFTLLGASATLIGSFLANNQAIVQRVAGVAIIILGLHLLEIIRIPGLMREARLDLNSTRQQVSGPLGSAFMGAAFGAGWTPCIGPVLASILAVASQANTVGEGMALLLVYSLGLGVPFILMALFLNRAIGKQALTRMRRMIPQLNFASGVLLLAMGWLVFSGNLIVLSNWITQTFGTGLTL